MKEEDDEDCWDSEFLFPSVFQTKTRRGYTPCDIYICINHLRFISDVYVMFLYFLYCYYFILYPLEYF